MTSPGTCAGPGLGPSSTASTDSSPGSFPACPCPRSSTTRATVSTIARKGPAGEERLDALLVGGVVDRRVGRRRPAPTCRARRHRGEGLVVQRAGTPTSRRVVQSQAGRRRPGAGPARPGPARSAAACRGGRRLGDAWTRRRTRPSSGPSDCGCTTTSIRSNGMSNSRWASITSSPLLTSVAELVVMTGPIAKLGWASAWSAVTSASSSRVRPRNGPPLAVTTSRRPPRRVPPRRHWAMARVLGVHGDDLAGLGGRLDQRPADDQRLLVGQRERRARRPGRPGSAAGRSSR